MMGKIHIQATKELVHQALYLPEDTEIKDIEYDGEFINIILEGEYLPDSDKLVNADLKFTTKMFVVDTEVIVKP